MVHLDAGDGIRLGKAGDGHAFGVCLRISLGSTDNGSCRGILLEADVDGVKVAIATGNEDLIEVGFKERQNNLGLGVAKATVVFQHGRAIRSEHHARIKDTNIRGSPFSHLLHSLDAHSFNFLVHIGGNARGGGIGSHTTGIETLVIVKCTLVILGGGHQDGRLSVTKGKTGSLRTGHKGFNNAGITGGTKGLVGHDLLHGLNGLCLGGGKKNSLAGSQARSLDDLTIIFIQ